MARTQVNGPEQALTVARTWLDAFNRRDAEALVRVAHPDVDVYPTKLFRHREHYIGHAGLRRWIADVVSHDDGEAVLIKSVRRDRSREILVVGDVLVHGRTVSPFTGLYVVRDGMVRSARSYLSDEQRLREVGHPLIEPRSQVPPPGAWLS